MNSGGPYKVVLIYFGCRRTNLYVIGEKIFFSQNQKKVKQKRYEYAK